MTTFHLISLGCAKNLVDSELILGTMTAAGMEFVEDPGVAEILLLNTCGFIQPAVEEAIEEILELVRMKEQAPTVKIVVMGCLVQRYGQKLSEELPEVDLFIGTEATSTIADYVRRLLTGDLQQRIILPTRTLMDSSQPRVLTTPAHRAWVKITEGCDNHCTYCMIPTIRGPLRSRPVGDVVDEVRRLEAQGVVEISFIAQDLTAYGNDFGQPASGLVDLLEKVLAATTVPWLRLLYLYPTGICDELLQLMADNPRIVPYLDIPFQHVSSRILKAMNRRYSGEDLYRLVERIRGMVPGIALRTTFLVGFPGESEADLAEVEQFMRRMQLDHVGVFPYANEDGCKSEHYTLQLDEAEKNRRRDHLLAVQSEISRDIQRKYLGRREQVLVEGVSDESDLLLAGRLRYQAPEVDGCVYITEGVASPGELVDVYIYDAHIYDLVGSISDLGLEPEDTLTE